MSIDGVGPQHQPSEKHNETILKDLLGLDESAIETLTAESVIGTRLKGID